mmetsp:Transcript_20334/g.3307  ORF Transcript_20334/g.3307 Transcript_20334/m.3307 type:complete len:100 (-) Transcript_20334:23-322(-)
MAPDRSLKAPVGSKPLYIPRVGREFGFPSTEGVSRRYKNVLARNMQKYKDRVQNPSKYQKPEKLPSILHPRGFTPSGPGIGEFNFTTTHMLPKSYYSTL